MRNVLSMRSSGVTSRMVLMVINATVPPTRDFLSFVSEYVHETVRHSTQFCAFAA